jgi:hypothetical protein
MAHSLEKRTTVRDVRPTKKDFAGRKEQGSDADKIFPLRPIVKKLGID